MNRIPLPQAPAIAGFQGANPYRAVQGMRGAMNVQRAQPFSSNGLPLGIAANPQAPRLPVLESVPMPQRQGIGNPGAFAGMPPLLTPSAPPELQRPPSVIPQIVTGPVATPGFTPGNSPVSAVTGSQSRDPVGAMSPTWNQGAPVSVTQPSTAPAPKPQVQTVGTPTTTAQTALAAALAARPSTTVANTMSAVTARNDTSGPMATDWNQGISQVAYSDITADPQRALDRILGRRTI